MDRTTSPHLEASNEGWGRWENHVILELQRLDNNNEALRQKVEDMKADIREVKVRKVTFTGVQPGGLCFSPENCFCGGLPLTES